MQILFRYSWRIVNCLCLLTVFSASSVGAIGFDDEIQATRCLNEASKHSLQGRLDLAELDYNQAVRLAPTKALLARAMFYEGRGKMDKAEADYARTSELGMNDAYMPNDCLVSKTRAAFFESIGKSDIAAPDWKRVFASDPTAILSFYNSKTTHIFRQESDLRTQVEKLGPSLGDNLVEDWLKLSNRQSELANAHERLLLEWRETFERLRKQKLIGRSSDQTDKMIFDCQKKALGAGEQAHIDGQHAIALGLFGKSGQFVEAGFPRLSIYAIKRFRQFRRYFDPSYSMDPLGLAKRHKQTYRTWISIMDGAVTNEKLGYAYYWSGQFDEAIESSKLALADPELKVGSDVWYQAKTSLALAYEGKKNYPEAISALQEPFTQFTGNKAFFYCHFARLHAKCNEMNEAQRYYDLALKELSTLDSSSRESASWQIAEVENLLGFHKKVIERLAGPLSNERLTAANQLLIRAYANAKLNKTHEAEEDLGRCKGWLDELPALSSNADVVANALSEARGAKFPLNTPVREKFALIIGIGQFRDQSIPKLRYAAKDAADVRDMLVRDYGFKEENIKLLTDQQATKGSILDALQNNWLPSVTRPEDLVLLFVSSHGTPTSKTTWSPSCVVVHDTDKEHLFSTSLPMEQICTFLRTKTKARKTLLIADTCYSGEIVKVLPSSVGGDKEGNLNPEDFVLANQMLVVSSSDVNQKSWESKRYPNGVFTRQLIESFRKHRNYSDFKQVFEDLRVSTSKEVKEDENAEQSPRLAGGTWTGVETGQ